LRALRQLFGIGSEERKTAPRAGEKRKGAEVNVEFSVLGTVVKESGNAIDRDPPKKKSVSKALLVGESQNIK